MWFIVASGSAKTINNSLLIPTRSPPLKNIPPRLRLIAGVFAILTFFLLTACGSKAAKAPPTEVRVEKPKPPTAVPMWLGNPARNFFGTGPIPKALKVIWDFKTGAISGRLHPDPWGGSGWPGQVAVVDDRVYFQSADSYIYCLNRSDASVIWKFKTTDCAKSTPSVSGDRLVVGNLDHYVYCLDTKDGSLVWKYQTGFETDSSSAIIGDRAYVGGEDHFYDGKVIWQTSLGHKSTSTPAVVNDLIYTATVNGYVFCYKKETGELVWKFNANTKGGGETNGFWASPIVAKDRIYIGSNNGYMYCLSTDKGEVIWRTKARAAIWGTSPVVDARVVFGDKAGWIHILSTDDGKQITEIKIGDNVDATPVVLDGRIYVGAFNGKFYCLGEDEMAGKQAASPQPSPSAK